MVRRVLPVGTVTFFFSDIENSTGLATRLGESWPAVLEEHAAVVRGAVSNAGGIEVSTEGDSFFCVFAEAPAALAAALATQRGLEERTWPDDVRLRVRIGLHSGSGTLGGDNYVGLDVHRAARIQAAGHGGQVLVSGATWALIADHPLEGVQLRDLGEHRLKGLEDPVHLYQVVADGLPDQFPPLRTLTAPIRVPVQLTTFIGRRRELEEVLGLLERARLVTLTGPGGTGKTRLAIAAAVEAAPRFPHGVFFVPLDSITDPDLVAPAILGVLGVQQVTGSPEERLVEYLGEKELLLVLDNFEQVLEAASVVSRLLAGAASVRIMVTSRSPLRVYGEQEFPVDPLTVPAPDDLPPAEELERFDSVALFVDRARAVRPDFLVDATNAEAVARIASGLEGLPLAIELAAARVRLLSPRAIVDRLGDRLTLLAGGSRDLPARQQTLRAAIAWSYDLLASPAQTMLRRAAVFIGGFNLDQAETVCHAGETDLDVLEGLGHLVDHNLLRHRDLEGEPRFRMLETIRDFALEELAASGEAAEIERRHAAAYLALAEQARDKMLGPDQTRWLDRLEADHDNIRAAFARAVEQGDASTADRLLWAVWRFWQIRGHLHEGSRRAEAALALPPADRMERCRAYDAAGGLAYWRADFEECRTLYLAALDLARDIGDRALLADALYNSAFVAFQAEPDWEEVAEGEAHLEEALTLYRDLGDRAGVGRALWGQGTLAWMLGDRASIERAAGLFEEASVVYRNIDDVFQLGWTERMLGRALLELGRVDEARVRIRAAIDVFVAARDVSAVTLLLLDCAIIA
ncbi:MAG TPA: adenylate/guanylate cyclase domain-containing protein, partial [Acidimicrobiia bacterium]|nr:adenylate/guanylate cyclase domain-containing protein [Acidimicrobiia bacterium]